MTKLKFKTDVWVLVAEGEYTGSVGLIVGGEPPDAFGPGWRVEFPSGDRLFIHESEMNILSHSSVMYHWQQEYHENSRYNSDE